MTPVKYNSLNRIENPWEFFIKKIKKHIDFCFRKPYIYYQKDKNPT